MPELQKNIDLDLQPPTAAGSRIQAPVRSTDMNGTVSPYRRIPHLGAVLTELFVQGSLPLIAAPLRFTTVLMTDTTANDGRCPNKAKSGRGKTCPPLHP